MRFGLGRRGGVEDLSVPRSGDRFGSYYDPDGFGRFSERIAHTIGTAKFLVIQTVAVVCWLVWNSLGPEGWRIAPPGPARPARLVPNQPLKLLADFEPTEEWLLAPGDMLYLPPGVPHHGIAVDHCLTFSVGMRAPSAAELLGDFVDTLAADAPEDLRYTDPGLAPASDANEIDGAATVSYTHLTLPTKRIV